MTYDLIEAAAIINQIAADLKKENDRAITPHRIAHLMRWSRLDSAALALILETWTEKLDSLTSPEFAEVIDEARALHSFLLDEIEREQQRMYHDDQALHRAEARVKDRLAK
jgi:hypothetical protein